MGMALKYAWARVCTSLLFNFFSGGRSIPNEDPMEEDLWISLRVLLSFATGADCIPPVGFGNQPEIEFDQHKDRDLPSASTCGPVLYLPLTLCNPYKFKCRMDFALCNCHGFGNA